MGVNQEGRWVAIANSGRVEMTSNNRNLGELTMADDSMTFWDVLGQQGGEVCCGT